MKFIEFTVHTTTEGSELVGREAFVGLVEGKVPGDADATEGDIDASQLLDERGDALQVRGIGEHSLLSRHKELGIDLAVHLTVHETAERQRVGLFDPCAIVGEILVHVDEPARFERELALVDEAHEDGILPHGANRADEDGLLAKSVLALDLGHHLEGHLVEHLAGVAQLEKGHACPLAKLLGRDAVVIVLHVSSFHVATNDSRELPETWRGGCPGEDARGRFSHALHSPQVFP